MCGIAGFLCSQNNSFLKNLKNLNQIKDILSHRGPDDHGIWYNNEEKIAFGHTRYTTSRLQKEGFGSPSSTPVEAPQSGSGQKVQ